MKRLVFATFALVLLAAGIGPVSARRESAFTLSRDEYYDKTLAGILGHVGGFLSGYEFLGELPFPDEWFRLTYGPYSGDNEFVPMPNYPGYDRLFADGRVGSDDDYHVDFFNQLILEDYGPLPAYSQIRDAWKRHQVFDWGAGGEAMKLINEGMLPPQTGQAEFNQFYWVSEPYIETETLGMVAPGLPTTARDLAGRFARVEGEFDSAVWGEFWAAMYALAYVETDARIALEKAAVALPANTWARTIYEHTVRLHAEYPDNWRTAHAELRALKRLVYRQDNIEVLPDINNALGVLSILYGENDYVKTAQIASLSGYDADCTAAAVLGVMGIIKGMAGTPEEILTRIYDDGKGVYVNDTETGFPPFIQYDYPTEQKWTDIAALYQRNAERQIVASGGVVEGDVYTIPSEMLTAQPVVMISNYDFELGDLTGWHSEGDAEHVFVDVQDEPISRNDMAHSGLYKGVVVTDEALAEARLYVSVSGLVRGQTYIAAAFLRSEGDGEARLFVTSGGETAYSTVVKTSGNPNIEWVRRQVEFVAQADTAQLGLHVPPGQPTTAMIDNLTLEPVATRDAVRYEAETATLTGAEVRPGETSGGAYVSGLDEAGDSLNFSVNVAEAGEYWLTINYANGTLRHNKLNLKVGDEAVGTLLFPGTGADGVFAQNTIRVPAVLQAGENIITLEKRRSPGAVDIDIVEVSR